MVWTRLIGPPLQRTFRPVDGPFARTAPVALVCDWAPPTPAEPAALAGPAARTRPPSATAVVRPTAAVRRPMRPEADGRMLLIIETPQGDGCVRTPRTDSRES